MYFQHADDIWADFPELVPGALTASDITAKADVNEPVARFSAIALERLAGGPESEFPEIRAWRRAFARMGLKPTQYRCASESLLRRFRKEQSLPRIHPLIDLCNAVSLAFAIPVAAFDVTRLDGFVEVRYADGSEDYATLAGGTEHPAPHEVIFADAAGRCHARRWTNRQSGWSAVRDETSTVLIVAEALHDTARADVEALTAALAAELTAAWPAPSAPVVPARTVLTRTGPRLEFSPAAS